MIQRLVQLTKKEVEISRSQIVTLKHGQNIKYPPYAFTEQGFQGDQILRKIKYILTSVYQNKALTKCFNKLSN